MKLSLMAVTLGLLITFTSQAQKLSTRSGYIRFFSETPVENIEAENSEVSSIIDLTNGRFAFLVPIKSFQFEKALMQEHFNENYMESGLYPKATFKGTIANFKDLDLSMDGEYRVKVDGVMTIHGTDKDLTEYVTFYVKEGEVSLQSQFNLRPEDYGVEIPAAKKDNISENIEVTVKMRYARK